MPPGFDFRILVTSRANQEFTPDIKLQSRPNKITIKMERKQKKTEP